MVHIELVCYVMVHVIVSQYDVNLSQDNVEYVIVYMLELQSMLVCVTVCKLGYMLLYMLELYDVKKLMS